MTTLELTKEELGVLRVAAAHELRSLEEYNAHRGRTGSDPTRRISVLADLVPRMYALQFPKGEEE